MRQLFVVALALLVSFLVMALARAQENPPAAPSDLVLGDGSATDLSLTWQDNSDNEESWRIERSETGESGPWELIDNWPSEPACPISGRGCYRARLLLPGHSYWFRVAAQNGGGISAYSNVASVEIPGPPAAQPGQILGIVSFEATPYFDLNNNGIRDSNDSVLVPPQKGRVDLFRGQELVQTQELLQSGSSGEEASGYSFNGVAPGDYTLVAHFDLHWDSCGGGAFSYSPLHHYACLDITFPWDTRPPQVATVASEAGANVNIVARPADVAVITGDAILETDRVPRGSAVVAYVNGHECGSTTVTGGANYDFAIQVLGAEERAGCATTGDAVQFTVGGVPAIDSVSWAAFGEPRGSPQLLRYHDIVAMQHHAWYWFQLSGHDLPTNGTWVQAVIDGTVCGEAQVEVRPEEAIAGFSRLMVPSEEIQAGCGRAGAKVSFLFNGVAIGHPIEWRPGLQYINPFARPIIATDIGLPTTGMAPDQHRGYDLTILVGTGLAGAVLLVAGLTVARGRGGSRNVRSDGHS